MATVVSGQAGGRDPHIGYVSPAGGRQGSVVEATVGGQFLRGATGVYVSGEGVRGRVVRHVPPIPVLDPEVLREVRRRLLDVAEKRMAELPPEARAAMPSLGGLRARVPPRSPDDPPVEVPDHPLLRNLDDKSLEELRELAKWFFSPRNLQPPQRAIAETVSIELTIDPSAPPGDREIRLAGPGGLTNPLCFQVGTLPEVAEREPNDRQSANDPVPEAPFCLNGQILPGDVDRYRFSARRGQRLSIEAQARHLMPYLADAVPGWFQATLALYDASGTEVAFDDENGSDPDPALTYEIPQDGEYELEIRDALYRGRDDFVYRVTVAEATDMVTTPPKIAATAATLDEVEPNDDMASAQVIELPQVIRGGIGRPGDVDVYRFTGRADDTVAAEVSGRRLGTELDSELRLTDATGAVVAWNDDAPDRESGLVTHHADSYLSVRLPADGEYYLRVADVQRHGGDAYGYRLRVGPPEPDFVLRVAPSGINVPAGRAAPVTVCVMRKDGFDGEVEVLLTDPSTGFALSGGRIPAGRESIRMTVSAPWQRSGAPVALHMEGRAQIGGQLVTRPVVPAEDMMQAFAYHHLVPAQQLLAMVTGPRFRIPPMEVVAEGPVRIPAGGAAQLRVRLPNSPLLARVQWALSQPPAGLSLGATTPVVGGLMLEVRADRDAVQVGYADNLIIEAFTDIEPGPPPGPSANQPAAPAAGQKARRAAMAKQRVSLGVLPAVPFTIVAP